MSDLIVKYLELYTLQQQSKEQLISKIMELQARDQELVENIMELHESKRESAKQHREELKEYEKRFENIFTLHAKNEIITEDYKRMIDLKLGKTFNINATWVDKIVFVLKEAKRPLRSSEIIDILKKNDIIIRTLADPQKGLSAHLTKALKYGRIIGIKQKGQNGYLFTLPI